MSRVGKQPVPIPEGVEVQLSDDTFFAKGPLGALRLPLSAEVSATLADHEVRITPKNEGKRARAMWGTTRALVSNMVTGVSKGFTVVLQINGVGFRAAVQDKTLNLQLGYSHEIAFPIPEDISITCERPTSITVSGIDRQKVGQIAANIRAYRRPEPYKGKGIKYRDEILRRKEGKKK